VEICRCDLVHDLSCGVSQHPLGADVEELDNALRVGGDAREFCAVEDRALQRSRGQQIFSVLEICPLWNGVGKEVRRRRSQVVFREQGVASSAEN
jgi:hypothetical protein